MIKWLKKHIILIVSALVAVGFLFYGYGCEPKVDSITIEGQQVTRAELQIELDKMLAVASMRMADLDKQEEFRNLILNNALMLARGQPFNPVGLITGVAAIYGIGQAGVNTSKTVQNARNKKKANNGQNT